jgi:class 3 adenylate cyclase
MSVERQVRYAKSGGQQIAFEIIGGGPIDIVVAFDAGTNLDVIREEPRIDQFLQRLGRFGRVIHLDPRGCGLSDPLERIPTLEEWVDDVRVVLKTVGARRAALMGQGNAAQLLMLFAATHPNQTQALVTINGYARSRRAPDYPWGFPPEAETWLWEFIEREWGTGATMGMVNPSFAATPQGRDWCARLERGSGTPGQALRRQKFVFDIDVRDVLATVRVPTLVIQSEGVLVPPGHAEFLVGEIAGAELMSIPDVNHFPAGNADSAAQLVDGIEWFLTGAESRPAASRSLMSVAFTDIVDSTTLAAEIGDKRWRGLLEVHESVARREVEASHGRLVKFTGDGLMATFDGPARATHCMKALRDALAPLGLPIRAGVHTGEVEVIGDDIGGLAVHIAARISALAGVGEILVSSTVRDLVAGSGLEFDDLGERDLKGVPGSWRVLAVR